MKFFKHKMENNVGLYSTIIFHLVLIIIMLLVSIHSIVSQESLFAIDLTNQEKIEEEIRVEQFKEEISKEIDGLLSTPRQSIRNVAVDVNENLKDDRSKNPNEVYDQAKELQEKLDAAKKEALAQEKDNDNYADLNNSKKEDKQKNKKAYKGPSVISYRLDGRKAQYLPVPAYKGYGSGDVTVEIKVNRKGRVIGARVIENISTGDISLRDFALEAAKQSRFTASTSDQSYQTGEIVYRFIGQ
jgi:TonB family protein